MNRRKFMKVGALTACAVAIPVSAVKAEKITCEQSGSEEFTISFPDGSFYKFTGTMDDQGKITSDGGMTCWVMGSSEVECIEIKEINQCKH